MDTNTFFCHLSSQRIAKLIENAKGPICYAGPGIQLEPSQAMAEAASRLGPEMITVWIDCDERVMRMGYGDIEAVEILRKAGIQVSHAVSLRSALIIVDGIGYTFTPTPLYLEAEPGEKVRNALRLSTQQVAEALARLSPAAKVIAIAVARTPEEKERIAQLPPEGDTTLVSDTHFAQVKTALQEAPPVKFDLARQVRVFESYLQYAELNLTGAAIQRHRLTIPVSIQKLGGGKDLEGRLRTTFDLIEKGGSLSSKPLEEELNEIRKNFSPSLGKDHGRVMLKAQKPLFEKRIEEFRERLKKHQAEVEKNLQGYLDDSRKQIVDYYLPRVLKNPPDALLGQLTTEAPSPEDATLWLELELKPEIPTADALIQKMKLTVRYKDVTFETLNTEDFFKSVKKVFDRVDWDKAYSEFRAAGEG